MPYFAYQTGNIPEISGISVELLYLQQKVGAHFKAYIISFKMSLYLPSSQLRLYSNRYRCASFGKKCNFSKF